MSDQINETAQLYSIRRLCPFRGSLQIIELPNARALSADGKSWELQIASRQPDTLWGSINTKPTDQQFFNFGIWSADQGLRQVPVNPIMDISAMLNDSATLLAAIKQNQAKVPYPLADHYEYWLLDKTMQPLALLASTNSLNKIDLATQSVWLATLKQEQYLFNQVPQDNVKHSPAERLQLFVEDAAGPQLAAQWFSRNNNGDADGMSGSMPPELVGRQLSASHFPELLVREQWDNHEQQKLFSEYIAWTAPLLLTLHSLSTDKRHQLEKLSAHRPEVVEKFWHVYPEIVDQHLMTRIRVAARLKNSTASLQPL